MDIFQTRKRNKETYQRRKATEKELEITIIVAELI
jgi:hypothetical protein